MKKSIVASAIMLLSASVAWAEPATIAGGKEGGFYARVAANLVSAMKDYKEFRGENAPIALTTAGSGENLELLNTGKVIVAPVQPDAFMWYLKKHPEAAGNLEILGELPKKECLFVITRKNGEVTSKSDLEKKSARIAIGNPDSGQNISWQYVTQLHPKYAQATTYEKDGLRTLNKVEAGGDLGLDAQFFAFAKDMNNDYVASVNTDGKNLQFIDFNDGDLNEKLPNGKQVYTFEDAKVYFSGWDRSVEVPCMSTLLLMNSNIDDKVADRLAGIVAKGVNRIVGQSDDANTIK